MKTSLNIFLWVELLSDCRLRRFFYVFRLGTLKFKEFGKSSKHLVVYPVWAISDNLQATLRYLHHAAFRR